MRHWKIESLMGPDSDFRAEVSLAVGHQGPQRSSDAFLVVRQGQDGKIKSKIPIKKFQESLLEET